MADSTIDQYLWQNNNWSLFFHLIDDTARHERSRNTWSSRMWSDR